MPERVPALDDHLLPPGETKVGGADACSVPEQGAPRRVASTPTHYTQDSSVRVPGELFVCHGRRAAPHQADNRRASWPRADRCAPSSSAGQQSKAEHGA